MLMPSKSEIQRRKTIVREITRREHADAEARMPISKAQLTELFDQLDAALKLGCDHTLRHTCAFLKAKGLSESTVVLWLGTYGGFCDCEVLGNVEAAWVR